MCRPAGATHKGVTAIPGFAPWANFVSPDGLVIVRLSAIKPGAAGRENDCHCIRNEFGWEAGGSRRKDFLRAFKFRNTTTARGPKTPRVAKPLAHQGRQTAAHPGLQGCPHGARAVGGRP